MISLLKQRRAALEVTLQVSDNVPILFAWYRLLVMNFTVCKISKFIISSFANSYGMKNDSFYHVYKFCPFKLHLAVVYLSIQYQQ